MLVPQYHTPLTKKGADQKPRMPVPFHTNYPWSHLISAYWSPNNFTDLTPLNNNVCRCLIIMSINAWFNRNWFLFTSFFAYMLSIYNEFVRTDWRSISCDSHGRTCWRGHCSSFYFLTRGNFFIFTVCVSSLMLKVCDLCSYCASISHISFIMYYYL